MITKIEKIEKLMEKGENTKFEEVIKISDQHDQVIEFNSYGVEQAIEIVFGDQFNKEQESPISFLFSVLQVAGKLVTSVALNGEEYAVFSFQGNKLFVKMVTDWSGNPTLGVDKNVFTITHWRHECEEMVGVEAHFSIYAKSQAIFRQRLFGVEEEEIVVCEYNNKIFNEPNLSLKKYAKKLGIGKKTVSKIKNGIRLNAII